MIKRLFLLLLALLTPAAGFAQPAPAPSELWQRADERITFTHAQISFPVRAGATTLQRAVELSRQGAGLDNGLQYLSSDERVFATVYIYYPGLPHAGVSAWATDNAIRVQSGDELRLLGSRVVAAGGRPSAAIRADYSGFRDERLASSAAFVKSGRWIVKLRVSGPEARRADVERTMTALLEGMRFHGEDQPRRAEPIEVGDCADGNGQAAPLATGDADDALEEAVIGVLDGAGDNGREEGARHAAATPELGRQWCLSSRLRIGDSVIPVLRSQAGSPGDHDRSVVLAIISDSGMLLEVVETRRRNRFVVLHHEIGRTRLLGAFAAVPSDEQIAEVLSGASPEAATARATIIHKVDGNTEVNLHVMPEAAPAAPTT
jgi:hypothetical protein